MTGDPTTVVVTEDFCNACGTPRVNVHHQSFPEMWTSGESVDQAVGKLANRRRPTSIQDLQASLARKDSLNLASGNEPQRSYRKHAGLGY